MALPDRRWAKMDEIRRIWKRMEQNSRLVSCGMTAAVTYFAVYINVQLFRKLLSQESIPKNTRLYHGPYYLALYYSLGISSGIMNYVADSLDEKKARWVRRIGWGILLAAYYFGTTVIDRLTYGR